MIINEKEYEFELKRKHVFMFAKILGVTRVKPIFDKKQDGASIMITTLFEILENIDKAEGLTAKFIADIYNIEEKEVYEIGIENEIDLWINLFQDEQMKVFFTKVLKLKNMKNMT